MAMQLVAGEAAGRRARSCGEVLLRTILVTISAGTFSMSPIATDDDIEVPEPVGFIITDGLNTSMW